MTLLQLHSALHPGSPEAREVSRLWWWMFLAGGTAWLIVTVMTIAAARRKRTVTGDDVNIITSSEKEPRLTFMIYSAVGVTVITLATFLVYDFRVNRKLVEPVVAGQTVNVVGHQWWWEFTYAYARPDSQVIVANELHVPVGVPVKLNLSANDVIHSFWLPSMNGKRDLVPGRSVVLQFRADSAGTYRGQCAEFCGMQHARMAFIVVAEPADAFARWLAHQRLPAVALDSSAIALNSDSAENSARVAFGREVFLSGPCATCHTVRGTDASGRTAPDLTHFASRTTIAAGTVPNTVDNLRRWITNPDDIKPGTQMPAANFSPDALRALVAYLETLR